MRVPAFHSEAEALKVPAGPHVPRLLPGSRAHGLVEEPWSATGSVWLRLQPLAGARRQRERGPLTCVLLSPVPRPQLTQLCRREVAMSPCPRGKVRELGKLVDGDPLVFNKACKARKDVKYGLKRKL